MIDTPASPFPARKMAAVVAFILICIGGAAYSTFFTECDACQWATSMLGGINLGVAGLIFYPTLLVLAILKKQTLLSWGFAFATGVHLALVSALIYGQTMCPPCCITATSAFLAMAFLLPTTRAQLFRMMILIAVVFACSGIGLLYLEHRAEQLTVTAYAKAIAEIDADRAAHPVQKGRARVDYFARKDCHFCAEFKDGVLKKITTEFKADLDSKEHDAFDHLPTPMVFVTGIENAMYKHPPTEVELKQAVLKAKGP